MVILFAVTMFVSAALLFLVQPMFAKMVLPLAGGTPAVWNTCVLFFQMTLLAGYAWAHLAIGRLGVKRHTVAQFALLLLPLLVLPIAIPAGWFPPAGHTPVPWLLGLMAITVGLPFLAVSTSAPTLQRWFSATDHPSARDPYFLYAASNLGSILALILYPVVLEPMLRLRDQARVWTVGYVLLTGLTVTCAVVVRRRRAAVPAPAVADQAPFAATCNPVQAGADVPAGGSSGATATVSSTETGIQDKPLTLGRRLRWLALAAVPSSLMLGVTMFLSTDIAPMPLLWVVPLSLYLLTFVIAFSPSLRHVRAAAVLLMAIFVLPLALLLLTATRKPLWMVVPFHLLAFFVSALVCHSELAKDRPPVSHLTEFYLWMSVGGMLGGLFNTLVAPAIFKVVAEYPLMLAAACLLRPWPKMPATRLQRALDVLLPVALAALTVGVILGTKAVTMREVWRMSALGAVLLVCFTFSRRPIRFGLGVGMLMLAGFMTWEARTEVQYRERTFFGVYQIEIDRSHELRTLMNGTTMHGAQSMDPGKAAEPITYYYRTSPIGRMFEVLDGRLAGGRIAVVGLGTGTLAAYAQPGQHWTFYEIDPAIWRISANPLYFTYLPACGERCSVVLGDARVSLGHTAPGSHALIVLDAFSSDAIPVHLMTREALALYMSRLAPHGIVAFHISNRHLALQPVLSRLAQDLGLAAVSRSDEVTDEESAEGWAGSDWVLIARDGADLEPLGDDWDRIDGRSGPDWTDDFSNILAVLSWK
jgi:hypothetical protein